MWTPPWILHDMGVASRPQHQQLALAWACIAVHMQKLAVAVPMQQGSTASLAPGNRLYTGCTK